MGSQESDRTERLHFHFSLSCIGEGHGNPLQCSCLENPRDGGAWWAVVYGVTQSRTRLKRLSSSSSSAIDFIIFSNGSFFFKDFFFNKDLFFESLLNLSICYDIVSVLHFGVFLVFFLVTRYVGS